jgi:sulfur-oxidizing protein SoxY
MDRRGALKVLGLAGSALTALMGLPKLAMASWAKTAFEARSGADALQGLYGGNATTPSDAVKLKAPDIAENGARVRIEVETDMDAESISILIEKNPSPLAGSFDLPAGTKALVKTAVRMGETTNVTAVVKSGGKLYTATKEVKVTIGGCGG